MKNGEEGLNFGKSLWADAWSGLAAAAMLLPQSMAFGVVLLSPYGIPAGTGALAGLIGAAGLSLASGIAGGTKGLISSPTGPMLILLTSALTMISASTRKPSEILAATAVLVAGIGTLQILIGISGGGKLIKFIPYSVVVGFMSGSAILMLISQFGPLTSTAGDEMWSSWVWLPALVAAATFAVTYFLPRFTTKLPATIAGLFAGTALFHLLTLYGPGPVPQSWTIGRLPGLASLHFGLDLTGAASLPWAGIAIAALAGAVLASLDTLLTSVIADVVTGTRHNARKELIGQGAGHLLGGLAGGIAGAGTTGATVVAVNSGGRRFTGVFAGVIIIIIVAAGSDLGTILPIAVLAGIIIRVSVGMLEHDILTWLKRRESRADALIATAVTLVTVFYDLMAAVGLGVLIAILAYLREQIKAPVIHRKFSGSKIHSVRHRTKLERDRLVEEGARVVGCELRGDLFFATADQLFEELIPDIRKSTILILNLRRVMRVDLTAAKILQQLGERLSAVGGELVFCEVHEGIGLGHDVAESLLQMSPGSKDVGIRTFNGMDEALEYAENKIIGSDTPYQSGAEEKVDLESMDILCDVKPAAIAELRKRLDMRTVGAGAFVFHGGDHGSELFFVLEGRVDIRLETTRHHYLRLAAYPAGTVFGEVAFLDPGPRSAGAVAVTDCELAILTRDQFHELGLSAPGAAIALLEGLSRLQSEEIRWSAKEIQRLGDW